MICSNLRLEQNEMDFQKNENILIVEEHDEDFFNLNKLPSQKVVDLLILSIQSNTIEQSLAEWMKDNVLELKSCSNQDIEALLKQSTIQSCEKGKQVLKIGDKADAFYILLRGELLVSIQLPSQQTSDKALHLQVVKRLKEMQSFGELGLMMDKGIRSSQISAKTDCLILTIPKRVYIDVLRDKVMEDLKRLWKLLSRVSYLRHWSERDIANIIYKLPVCKYSLNQSVYMKGDSPTSGIFFVLSGEFEIRRQVEIDILSQREKNVINDIYTDINSLTKMISVQIAVVSSGCSFGEEEVILNESRKNSIVCISEGAEVYAITKNEIDKKMMWEPNTKKALLSLIQQRSRWANKKIEEFKKTIDISKSMRISRKLTSDMLSLVESEKLFSSQDPASSSSSLAQSRDKVMDVIRQKKSNYFETSRMESKSQILKSRRETMVSGTDSNQDNSSGLTLQESIALDILKDQKKILTFEGSDDDEEVGLNPKQQIRKQQDLQDQIQQLLLENSLNTQRFEAIDNDPEEVEKVNSQSVSFIQGIISKKILFPEVDSSLRKNKGENIQTFRERLKKVSNFKKVKDDKKSILSSELNGLFQKYFLSKEDQEEEEQVQEEPQLENYEDFNFVRNLNKKIESSCKVSRKKMSLPFEKQQRISICPIELSYSPQCRIQLKQVEKKSGLESSEKSSDEEEEETYKNCYQLSKPLNNKFFLDSQLLDKFTNSKNSSPSLTCSYPQSSFYDNSIISSSSESKNQNNIEDSIQTKSIYSSKGKGNLSRVISSSMLKTYQNKSTSPSSSPIIYKNFVHSDLKQSPLDLKVIQPTQFLCSQFDNINNNQSCSQYNFLRRYNSNIQFAQKSMSQGINQLKNINDNKHNSQLISENNNNSYQLLSSHQSINNSQQGDTNNNTSYQFKQRQKQNELKNNPSFEKLSMQSITFSNTIYNGESNKLKPSKYNTKASKKQSSVQLNKIMFPLITKRILSEIPTEKQQAMIEKEAMKLEKNKKIFQISPKVLFY